MAKSSAAVLALDTPALLRLAGIPASTLNHWVLKGFITPTHDLGSGRRAVRYWTVEDAVVVKAIKALRDAGCSLQLVSKVEERLRRSFDANLASAVLYYDGSDVFIDDRGVIISLIREAGQSVLKETVLMAAYPLDPWMSASKASAELVDLDAIRDRRNQKRTASG
jgi:DNA-binding transcriptional MerR regulator